MQRRSRVVTVQQDASAIDAVEQVKADIGLTRHIKRFADQRAGLVAPPFVQGHFSQALQRKRFARRTVDGAVQPRALAQMLTGRLKIARQQLRLATQRDAERIATSGSNPLRLAGQLVGKRDDLRVGPRPVEKALGDAELAIEHTHGEVRHVASLVQVVPDTLMQFPASVRCCRLGPRRNHQRGGVTGLQRQPARLGRLGCAGGRVAHTQCRRTAVGQCHAQLAIDRHRLQSLQRLQGTLGVALLYLGQRGPGAQIVAVGLAGHSRRSTIRRHRGWIALGVERFGAQAQGLGVIRLKRQHRLQVAQSVAESRDPHRVARRCDEPWHRSARAARVEQMTRDTGWRHVQFGLAQGNYPVHFQPPVWRDLLD